MGDVIRLAAGDMIPADAHRRNQRPFRQPVIADHESEPMEKWTVAQPQTGGNPLECNNCVQGQYCG